jgi:pimeloyl-ACP methyl ester carboxylesterase
VELGKSAIAENEPLPTRSEVITDGARVTVHRTGDGGSPLLLIHSINAAASAAEVEPLRRRYGRGRRVLCIDLPGFGESERSDRRYDPRLMTDAILTVARQASAIAGGPIDALAVSLSCEFLARAASEEPTLFRSIALVSPTAFTGNRVLRDPAGSTRGKQWLYALLRGPGWGAALFRQLTRPKVIRYFLERTWGSKLIDEPLWRADILTSRYPGAHFAPLYFLSAILFSADIHTVYDSLTMPVWVTHGQRGDFVDYRQLPSFVERNRWSATVFNTGAMIYFEDLIGFAEAYDRFLQNPETAS